MYRTPAEVADRERKAKRAAYMRQWRAEGKHAKANLPDATPAELPVRPDISTMQSVFRVDSAPPTTPTYARTNVLLSDLQPGGSGIHEVQHRYSTVLLLLLCFCSQKLAK